MLENRKILWAFDGNNLVHVDSAYKEKKYTCISKQCEGELIVAEGYVNQKHYKHKAGGCAYESYEHSLAKNILKEVIERRIPFKLIYECVECGDGSSEKFINEIIVKASLEEKYGSTNHIADVVGSSDNGNRKIYFEVLKTHKVDDEKRNSIEKNHHWVEIEAEEIIESKIKAHEGEFSLNVRRYGGGIEAKLLCDDCKELNHKAEALKILLRNKEKPASKLQLHLSQSCKLCKTKNVRTAHQKRKFQDIRIIEEKKKPKQLKLECKADENYSMNIIISNKYEDFKGGILEENKNPESSPLNIYLKSYEIKEGKIIIEPYNFKDFKDDDCHNCRELRRRINNEKNLKRKMCLIFGFDLFGGNHKDFKNEVALDDKVKWLVNRNDTKMLSDHVFFLIDNGCEKKRISNFILSVLNELNQYGEDILFNENSNGKKLIDYALKNFTYADMGRLLRYVCNSNSIKKMEWRKRQEIINIIKDVYG